MQRYWRLEKSQMKLCVICVYGVGKATWTNAWAAWLFVLGDSDQEKASIEAYKWALWKIYPSCLENVALSGICEFVTASPQAKKRRGKPFVVSQILWRWPRWLRGHTESSACSSSICTPCGKSSFGWMETGMRPRSYSSDPGGEEAFLRPARLLLSVLWPHWKNVFVGKDKLPAEQMRRTLNRSSSVWGSHLSA